jgi:hypothetical protein
MEGEVKAEKRTNGAGRRRDLLKSPAEIPPQDPPGFGKSPIMK